MAIDELTYPAPNLSRSGPGPSSQAAAPVGVAPSPPRSRAFWFELRTNATSRTTISTPLLRGPVVVSGIQWGTQGSNDAANWYLDVGINTVPISETNVAVATVRGWRTLFEDMVPRSVNVSANLIGMPSRTGYGAVSDDWWPINQLIQESAFHLILSILNNTAGVRGTHGTIYVVEGVSPEAVANFL
jgi:hypothetical protein